MKKTRKGNGQAIVQGVAAVSLVTAVAVAAITLTVDIGTTIYFTDKLGFICNQLSIKFAGFAPEIDRLPANVIQSDAVALGSAMGITINPANVHVTELKQGATNLLNVSITNATAPLLFQVLGPSVNVSSSAAALPDNPKFNNKLANNDFDNYNDTLLLPVTGAGGAFFPGFVVPTPNLLPKTTMPGGIVPLCLIQAAGGGAPALGQLGGVVFAPSD